jgi:hypothetical protein
LSSGSEASGAMRRSPLPDGERRAKNGQG